MTPVRRRPDGNNRLAAVLADSGLSNAGLARRVNDLARRQGVTTRYDKASVTRWLQGKHPRGRGPEFITAALAERLGRTLIPADLGFVESDAPPITVRALAYAEDVSDSLHTIAELGSIGVSRRSLLGVVPFTLGSLADPQRHWLLWLAELDDSLAPKLAAACDSGVVEPVHFMIQTFDEMDNRFGGAHVRAAIVHYLTTEVIPLLQRHGIAEKQRRPLFTAAAKLAATAGWSSYDSAEYGLAERYMIQALRFCQEGGDQVLGGQIWAGLSHLATNLGHPQEGVDLARTGLATAKHSGSPLGLMRIHAMAARGHAAQGNTRQATASLTAAEAALDVGRGPDHESPWVRYLDRHYLEAEAAHCFRDLGDAHNAAASAASSVRANAQRGRRHAISQSLLATAQLQQHQLDAALHTAKLALDKLGSGAVHSERTAQTLRDFRTRLAPHRDEPAVRDFEQSAVPVLGAA